MTWRQVVVLNVVPGLVMSLLLLVFLGTLRLGSKATAKNRPELANHAEDPPSQTLAEYGRGLRALLRNRGLLLLSTSGAFVR